MGQLRGANAAWAAWNEEVARCRVHGTHGELVAEHAARDRAALLALPHRPYLVVTRTTRRVGRDGFVSFEGRRYQVSGARPAERVEITIGADELELRRLGEARLLVRHERGLPRLVLSDPAQASVSLAELIAALPRHQVHARPIAVYEEASRG